MSNEQPYRNCPSCEGSASTLVPAYSQDQWEIVNCDACGFTFLRNPPGYQALEEEFAWEKTYAAKKAASKGSTFLSPALNRIRKKFKLSRDWNEAFHGWFHDGDVLDVGCGAGGRIAPPMTPYGIELSVGLHKIADEQMKKRGGFCVFGAGAEAIWEFDEAKFDGIVMFSYLEHENAVLKVLKGAHRALKDTGRVFVRVPNYASINRRVIGPKWCGFRYPDHVNYFTLQSLTEVARKTGFSTQLVNTFSLPFDDNIIVLLRKTKSTNEGP